MELRNKNQIVRWLTLPPDDHLYLMLLHYPYKFVNELMDQIFQIGNPVKAFSI
jgi:hypothetical protein